MGTQATSFAGVSAGDLVEEVTFVDVTAEVIPGAEFYKCRFERCVLNEARSPGAVFESCTFVDCDLTRVRWANAPLRGVAFVDCKLMGADFSGAGDNPEVRFERCLLRYAVFDDVNMGGATFADCQLQESSFVGTNLRETDFSKSDLTRAVIKGAALAGADLSTADGVFFDPALNQSKDAFIAVDAAVQMAQARGLRVKGYDRERPKKSSKR